MRDDFYYDGPEDEIIDEDRIGKVPNDSIIISLVFGIASLCLAFFFRSGLLAFIFAIVSYVYAISAMQKDRRSTLARVARAIAIAAIIIAAFNLVTCGGCFYSPYRYRYKIYRGWRY